jgi:hypothetical protein
MRGRAIFFSGAYMICNDSRAFGAVMAISFDKKINSYMFSRN